MGVDISPTGTRFTPPADGTAVVAVILNPDQAPQAGMWRAVEAAAPSLGVKATATPVHNAVEIERAINAFAREPNGGLIVLPSGPVVGLRSATLVDL